MLNENLEKDQENIQDGQAPKSIEEKVELIGKKVYMMSAMHGNALDMMYIQLMTIIEILSDAKLLTPELWEEKITEVTKDMEVKIKEQMDAKAATSGKDNGSNPDGTNEGTRDSKIIIPDSRIIIP